MKKILVLSIVIALALPGYAEKTYIPKYNSVIAIAQGLDTIYEDNNRAELVLDSRDGVFRVGVVHEVLTMNRIKSIRTQEASHDLTAFATFLFSLSALSPNSGVHLRGLVGAYASANLTAIYAQNVEKEKTLGMDVVFLNTSGEELMVSDVERGLVWFVQSDGTLTIPAKNPDVLQLRVSDVHHTKIYFVQVGGGSVLKQIDVEWEDEDYWAFPIYSNQEIIGYMLVSKATGEMQQVSDEAMLEIERRSSRKKKK